MKTLTVFTPTYNRAFCLPQLYKSLCRQTSQDFEWLLIDDGSKDNTQELINSWIADNKIKISYAKKDNGGMHTGHNLAYQLIETELNVCIDSDDYMPDNAVALILKTREASKSKDIAGIVGLDATKDGAIIGSKLPNVAAGSFMDIYGKHQCTGDKKVVLKTAIVKQYPSYPEYENEKLVPLGILYNTIGLDYDFIYANDVYCIVEYLEGGSSDAILKQYKQSPRGFAYSRKVNNKATKAFTGQVKNAVHIGSSAIFAKDMSILKEEGRTLWNILLLPMGALLNGYIRWKTRK